MSHLLQRCYILRSAHRASDATDHESVAGGAAVSVTLGYIARARRWCRSPSYRIIAVNPRHYGNLTWRLLWGRGVVSVLPPAGVRFASGASGAPLAKRPAHGRESESNTSPEKIRGAGRERYSGRRPRLKVRATGVIVRGLRRRFPNPALTPACSGRAPLFVAVAGLGGWPAVPHARGSHRVRGSERIP